MTPEELDWDRHSEPRELTEGEAIDSLTDALADYQRRIEELNALIDAPRTEEPDGDRF